MSGMEDLIYHGSEPDVPKPAGPIGEKRLSATLEVREDPRIDEIITRLDRIERLLKKSYGAHRGGGVTIWAC